MLLNVGLLFIGNINFKGDGWVFGTTITYQKKLNLKNIGKKEKHMVYTPEI